MAVELIRSRRPGEQRSADQLWEQYQIEKELAHRLRTAARSERRSLYSSAYEELFAKVPHHSQLRKKVSEVERAQRVSSQMVFLQRFLSHDITFMEIGAGDCALSLAVARQVRKVYALDVSAEITRNREPPANFELVLSDGTSIPAPEGSVHVAYSFQLMEHLHPEDALEQLSNIYRVLAPGGKYLCLTPNRLTGPHDISRYFDSEATGFHLKEYTCNELAALFHKVGFKDVQQYLRCWGTYIQIPLILTSSAEAGLMTCPGRLRTALADANAVRSLLDIRLVACK
jgi:ubiquinone/menaquinone biosynthesis C-methylase UbiE